MSAPFLLDTCVCIWMVEGKLSRKALDFLTKAHNSGLPSYVSPITAWEFAMSARQGRLKSQLSPQRWFASVLAVPGLVLAEISPDVLIESQLLLADMMLHRRRRHMVKWNVPRKWLNFGLMK